MRGRLLAALWALLALPAAGWADDIRPQEQARLDRFEAIAGEAILEALAGGSPQDIAALTQALSGPAQVAFDPGLSGDWRCRALKLGRAAALTVYSQFECRMALDLTGVRFEKISGSERTTGRITLRDGRAVYLGVGHLASETAQAYSDLDPTFEGTAVLFPQVAVFERVSNRKARLMFPAPLTESDFDILELTRAD